MIILKRTKLKDRVLPNYTKGEEIFNMVTHIVGGGIGIVALVLCVVFSAIKGNVIGVISSAIYGVSLISLYSMSSIYHGLHKGTAKKVLQVLDHCNIYFLIAGTYTPILLCSIIKVSKLWAFLILAIVWGLAALATVLTAIDLKKYSVFSMICYIGMGWCIILAANVTVKALHPNALALLFAGGISYTLGAILYGIGSKIRYFHSIFHIFVVLGSLLHFFCILFYVI